MKTPMKELIDNVIPMHVINLIMIKQDIAKSLEKEKEHIIKAFEFGVAFKYNKDGLEYYNETYNK